MNQLFVDAGSTSTKCAYWNGVELVSIEIDGINPRQYSKEHILRELKSLNIKPDSIKFFGSGCGSPNMNRRMTSYLRSVFHIEDILVSNDIEAARLATIGDGSGLVGILGTGSYFMKFENGVEVANRGGFGYLLGDEGSGYHLANTFVRYYLQGSLSGELTGRFEKFLNMDKTDFVNHVYQQEKPNQYIASLAWFLVQNREESEVQAILKNCFDALFKTNLEQFGVNEIHLVGGVSSFFRKELEEVFSSYGLKIVQVQRSPITAVASYFLNQQVV